MCKAYGRRSARAGTPYLSCRRSSPADAHVRPTWNRSAGDPLPGTTTASALNEQYYDVSEGLSRALRTPGCGPSAPPTPTPSRSISTPVHLAPFLSQAGWGLRKTELPGMHS